MKYLWLKIVQKIETLKMNTISLIDLLKNKLSSAWNYIYTEVYFRLVNTIQRKVLRAKTFFFPTKLDRNRLIVCLHNPFYLFLYERVSNYVFLFALFTVILFGPPIILNYLNGTFVQSNSFFTLYKELGTSNIPQEQLVNNVLFLNDPSVLLFLLYPFHTVIQIRLWRFFEQILLGLKNRQQLVGGRLLYSALVNEFNEKINRTTYNLAAIIGSLFMASLMFYFSRRTYSSWWGTAGILGTMSFFWMALIVWHQLLLHNFRGIGAVIVLQRLLKNNRIKLHFNHADDSYGLSDVTSICVLSYATTIIHMLSVYLVIQLDFVYVYSDLAFVIILLFFIIFMPVFTFYPAFRVHRYIVKYKKHRQTYLKQLALNLEKEIGFEAMENPNRNWDKLLQLSQIRSLHDSINELPSHSFGRIAIVIPLLYLLQIIVAIFRIVEYINS